MRKKEPRAPLTGRQNDVYQFILGRRPVMPTYREIADALGFASTNTAHGHVLALIRKGWMRAGPVGKARSLEIVKEPRRAAKLPVLLTPTVRCRTCVFYGQRPFRDGGSVCALPAFVEGPSEVAKMHPLPEITDPETAPEWCPLRGHEVRVFLQGGDKA